MIRGKNKCKPIKNPKPKKKRAGRKTHWESRIAPRLLEIAAWCRDGHTDIEMSKALRISISCFCKYKKIKKRLKIALTINKEIADINVENSLFKRAMGYNLSEVTKKITYVLDAKGKRTGETEMVVVKTVSKHLPGETKAIERWLMNRKPKTWRSDKDLGPGNENKDEVAQPVEITFMPVDGRVTKPEVEKEGEPE